MSDQIKSNGEEEGNMTLIAHIRELRTRLYRAAIFIFLGVSLCWGFSDRIFDFVREPAVKYLPSGGLFFTAPMDKFMAHLNLSIVAGLILAAPFWLYQLWKFISPALYKNEKKVITGFVFFGTLQFLVGVAFCYYVVLPGAIEFLFNFGGDVDKPMITIREYIGFFTQMSVMFGLTFEIPVVLTFLGFLGIVSQAFLKEHRRYSIVINAVIAAVAAPPDTYSMVLLMIPLLIMYEISIISVGIFEKKKLVENNL